MIFTIHRVQAVTNLSLFGRVALGSLLRRGRRGTQYLVVSFLLLAGLLVLRFAFVEPGRASMLEPGHLLDYGRFELVRPLLIGYFLNVFLLLQELQLGDQAVIALL